MSELAQRLHGRTGRRALGTVLALVISFGLTSALMLVLGANPLEAFNAIWQGAFGTEYAIGQTLQVTSVLVLAALAAALPFRAGILNVGAEGQMTAGAVVATAVILGTSLPGWLLVPAALVAGLVGGAVWGALVGGLKGYLGTNEVISALMLNFVAILVADYVIAGRWADDLAPQTRRFPDDSVLPSLPFVDNDYLSALLLALVLIGLGWLFLERSAYGFGLRLFGANPDAAKRAGLDGRRKTLAVMVIGGAVAGLAGVLQATTVNHALIQSPAQGYGYTAIAVALLATLRIQLIPLAALFFAALTVGANSLPAITGVSTSAATIVQSVFVICLLAAGVVKVKGAGSR